MRLSYMAALAVLAGCGSSTSSEVTLSATITDPAGDALSADVVGATAQIVGDDLILTVTFAPGSFRSDSLLVQFNLDTDENEFTGYTTSNPGSRRIRHRLPHRSRQAHPHLARRPRAAV